MLKSEIRGATVTESVVGEQDCLLLDRELLKSANLWPFERVEVLNLDNGARFSAYATEAPAGSGAVVLRGPSAHLAREGHRIAIVSYVRIEESELPAYRPRLIRVGARNRLLDNV